MSENDFYEGTAVMKVSDNTSRACIQPWKLIAAYFFSKGFTFYFIVLQEQQPLKCTRKQLSSLM